VGITVQLGKFCCSLYISIPVTMKFRSLFLFPIFIMAPIITLNLKPSTAIVQPADTAQKAQVDELNMAGEKLFSKSEYSTALDQFRQGLVLAKKVGYQQSESNALNGIGKVHQSLGEYPKALEYSQEALTISRAIGYKAGESNALNTTSEIYHSLGQYPKALEYSQEALSISKVSEYQVGESNALNNIGQNYRSLGQYPKALEHYQQSLVISKAIQYKAGEGNTLNNIARVYRSLGQYPKALEYYQQSLVISKAIGNKAGEGTTLNNIGRVYSSLGQYAKTLEYYQQSLSISKAIRNKAGEGATLNNIGEIYSSLGQYEKALEYYQPSLVISQKIWYKAGERATLNNIGRVYQLKGQYEKALEYYQPSLTISRAIGYKAGEGATLNNIGEVYSSLGQHEKALEYYQPSLVISKDIGYKYVEGTTLTNIGGALLAQKKPFLAEQPLRDAITIWEGIRSSKTNSGQGLGDSDKVAFADRIPASYKLLQKVLIEQNKLQEALEIAERGRASALVELLASKISMTSAASRKSIRQAPSLAKIQQIAKTKQATLVQYSIIDDDLIYIWVIKPSGEIVFKQSKLPAKTKLKDLIVATRQNIGAENRPDNLPEALGDLQQLYKLLIEPIAKDLPTNPEAEVVILPQRELFLVPFAALQDAQEKYLIEKHTLTIAPSIQVLGLTNTKRASNPGKPIVVGNPIMPTDYKNQAGEPVTLANLPGSEAEAKTVAEILQVSPLIGQAADKQKVVGLLQNSSIVHLATHGLLGTLKGDIPGAIVLTNGFLTASEIFDMQLQADLVVLSACDTGRGDLTGDGVVGLSRSLAVAGVPSVIVSLWEVSDDATMSLMSEFYRNLRVKKLAKSKALRQAMLTTMQQYPKPVLWSAFMLVGEGR
jgi:CHAT domain-containing protein